MTGPLVVPDVSPGHDTLAAALAYAAAGWYVGPVKADTKNPGSLLGKDWQRRTSRDPQVISAWFAGTDHGVFLHAGQWCSRSRRRHPRQSAGADPASHRAVPTA